jgi:hypothetical protein
MSTSTASQVPGLYHVIPFRAMRRTPGVSFDTLKLSELGEVAFLDRVIHVRGAVSPGPVGYAPRPWYMHTHQIDNLVVLHGTRYVDLYSPAHGVVESFTVKPDLILHGQEVLAEGGAILGWPVGVFHRIISCDKEGSASLNLAVHRPGLDLRANFSIYDLDVATGQYRVIRAGHLDQPGM